MSAGRAMWTAAGAVLRRPGLWPTALIEYGRLVPDRWWRRRPWLPVPDQGLLAFRAETQYGDAGRPPDADDVVSWLEWCKAENRRRRVR